MHTNRNDEQFKIIVEKHWDCYVAYPVAVTRVIVGDGATYEDALADVRSAIQFRITTVEDAASLDDSRGSCPPASPELYWRGVPQTTCRKLPLPIN